MLYASRAQRAHDLIPLAKNIPCSLTPVGPATGSAFISCQQRLPSPLTKLFYSNPGMRTAIMPFSQSTCSIPNGEATIGEIPSISRSPTAVDGNCSLTGNSTVAYAWCMWDDEAIFKALGDSTRRLILDELCERNEQTLYELTVRLITKHNLTISRQAVSKHLAVLDEAGLVKSIRKGKYRVLTLNKEPLKNLLKRWLE